MKKIATILLGIFIVSSLFLFENCNRDNLDPYAGNWTEAEKESYVEVLQVQDQVGNDLDDWFQTMDSLDAINQAYQAFVNSEFVNSATINSQGIAVQYANGMRGGLYLNPEDDKSGMEEKELFEKNPSEPGNGLKSLVNQRKMILINPHYWERSYYTDQIKSIDEGNLAKVDMTLSTFYKNEEATVDRFTELSGYGIIQIYSHGAAWPKKENITDIYLLTGETANETTSKKYWDELKTGNIPIMKVSNVSNKYFLSPEFITDNNDFSNDTVFFFGGFCYSFLGGWPDIIDDFGDGAYTGYDWSVYTHKNANWSVNSVFNLSDTTADQPITINDWFNDTEVPKSYWNSKYQRYVTIHYAGDGALTLWDDVKVRLIPLSSDGTPVNNPGEAGVAYPFKCEVIGDDFTLEYVWDIGDGSSPVTASNEVNITWSEEGEYILKVDVIDGFDNSLVGTARVNVKIGSTIDVKEYVLSCNTSRVVFGSGGSSNITIWDIWSFNGTDWPMASDYGDLVWNGLSFSGTTTTVDGESWSSTNTISGTLSSDGQVVSFVAEQEGFLKIIDHTYYHYYKLTVDNAPLYNYEPLTSTGNGRADYGDEEGQNAQNYVTAFEGRRWTDEGTFSTVTGIDWDNVEQLFISFGILD